MEADSPVNMLDALGRDMDALCNAAMRAARQAEWLAVERYEHVRHELVRRVGTLAAEAGGGQREAAVRILRQAQTLGLLIEAALAEGRRLQDARATEARQSRRAGRAYEHACTA